MGNLLIKPLKQEGKVFDISPESAGWKYVGFKLYKLKEGETVCENTANEEAILVFLEGYTQLHMLLMPKLPFHQNVDHQIELFRQVVVE